jgi:excisionase family DNA binding protein
MNEMATIPGYYTIEEAAKVIGRARSQVTRYIQKGLLKAVDLGHQKLIEQTDAHNFSPPPRGNPMFRKCRQRNHLGKS